MFCLKADVHSMRSTNKTNVLGKVKAGYMLLVKLDNYLLTVVQKSKSD